MWRFYTQEDFENVLALTGCGLGFRAVARETGIAHTTIRNWVLRPDPPRFARPPPTQFEPVSDSHYAYLLGQYLGDGYLFQKSAFSCRLCISSDSRYRKIIDEISAAILSCDQGTTLRLNPVAGSNCICVLASSPLWPLAFPQHGPGRRHERAIELEGWQREITHREPEALLRGLIHSDGARCINRFRTKLPSGRVAEYEYPGYFFSNLSADIRAIFCEHCDLVGVRWTRSNHRNISVSHRRSTAILDRFIGPKC